MTLWAAERGSLGRLLAFSSELFLLDGFASANFPTSRASSSVRADRFLPWPAMRAGCFFFKRAATFWIPLRASGIFPFFSTRCHFLGDFLAPLAQSRHAFDDFNIRDSVHLPLHFWLSGRRFRLATLHFRHFVARRFSLQYLQYKKLKGEKRDCPPKHKRKRKGMRPGGRRQRKKLDPSKREKASF